MSAAENESGSLRVVVGLSKISLALRNQAWQQAEDLNLTPTQGQILSFLKARTSLPSRLTDVAEGLGVTVQTASVAIAALLKKGLLRKQKHPDDARAMALYLTAEGERIAQLAALWPDFLLAAVESLTLTEQDIFLRALVKMIRILQDQGQISVSRMCTTCRYFRPGVHPEPRAPHHCNFVDAAFGDRQLRFDCAEHESAPIAVQDQLWSQFLESAS
jgi:DNA-binding MarR family transcriptional regulator